MSESKPTPAVGQRWKWTREGDEEEREFRIIGESVVYGGKIDPAFVIEYVGGELGTQTRGSISRFCLCLGSPPPSPVSGGMMEVRDDGAPARCLFCGGAKPVDLGFACRPCFNRTARLHGGDGSFFDAVDAWDAGARDFPRLPQPSQGAPKDEPAKWCKCASEPCVCQSPTLESPTPIYGRMVGEMRSQDGRPMSALEAIKAKREPEPWIPSVDEFDLLPDAPGVVR